MMANFTTSIQILHHTPVVLQALLKGNAGIAYWKEEENTWTIHEILAHLVACEQENFMMRIEHVLSGRADEPFQKFNMQAQQHIAKNHSLTSLLEQFSASRNSNLKNLMNRQIKEDHGEMKGLHPELGEVTIGQLIATWAAHDITHQMQILRIIARPYRDAVGPFIHFLRRI